MDEQMILDQLRNEEDLEKRLAILEQYQHVPLRFIALAARVSMKTMYTWLLRGGDQKFPVSKTWKLAGSIFMNTGDAVRWIRTREKVAA